MTRRSAVPSLVDVLAPEPVGAKIPQQMPDHWFIVFHDRTERRWLHWLAWGRFKHVSCFGWVESAQRWVFFDPALERNWLRLVPDEVAGAEPLHVFDIKAGYHGGDIGHYSSLGTVVQIDNQTDQVFDANIFAGRGCVRDVARLVGIRTWALRPDAFFRACLKLGGQVIAYRGKSADAEAFQ